MNDARTIRTSIPADDWQALSDLAQQQGTTLAGLARNVLVEHARSTSLVQKVEAVSRNDVPTGKLGADAWKALTDWFTERGEDPRRAGCTTRQEALAWARSNGYPS